MPKTKKNVETSDVADEYSLSEQIGYLLRLANQRHLEIFQRHMPDLTPTQFSLLVKLHELGGASQNELGRHIGIDAATTNGVVDRLLKKQFVQAKADPADKRRLKITLTTAGQQELTSAIPVAQNITHQTLEGLSPRETERLIQLLKKIHD